VRDSLLILLCCLVSIFATAQSTEKDQSDLKGIILKNELSFGVKLTSNGWAVFGEKAKRINIYKTRIWQFEIGDIKVAKETKQAAEFNLITSQLDSPKDFFYGKQNEFFVMRAGFGQRKNLVGKAEKNGVNLSLIYLGGISLGFLKPYYLELAYFTPVTDTTFILESRSESYNPDLENGNADKFLNWREIIGSSGFGKGFIEIEPVPGIYGKVGLNFEWGKKDEMITSLEAGIMMDIYYKRIPIMIVEKNRPFFMAAYISFQFGKRWK